MNWNPLLDRKATLLAERALERIVDGLVRLDREEAARGAEQPLYNRGLAGGVAGQALFWAYLARCRGDEGAAERALSCLDRAGDELAETEMDASFYGGISGVGWVGAHLTGLLFEADDEDPFEEIDQALLDHLGQRPWRGHFDLVSGLAGFGVYALERLPRPAAREAGEQIVGHLAELAEQRPVGITWHTPPELLPAHQLEICPRGYDNLGVAHGTPGVIGFLAGACRAGIAADTAWPLLEGAVDWLFSTRLPDGAGSIFPNFVSAQREPEPSRLAWCYGDPGIAATLVCTARCVGRAAWAEEASAIARAAAGRTLETSGVQDHGLCHGTAGLGHLFHRIYRATGDEVCGDAARFWFGHALSAEPPPGEWETGFPSLRPHPGGRMEWVEETGLLTGAAGVGLALLAATTGVEPDWDRALLLAIPPQPGERSEATHDEQLAASPRG